MDSSHLAPAAFKPNHADDSQSEFRPSSPSGRDIHVDVHPDRQLDSRNAMPSNIGATVRQPRKTLVLCFDGTGNEFHGDSSDSNILKIFRMLDRSSGKGFHYYQPGIGTYVAESSLSPSGSLTKLKNWYLKAKDSAVGSSFDVHVVGGYKFLMQFYSPGDNIYMFGFSRGSYTARFLGEMIDWVGLITHGNEEMIQFAWRTFSKWKSIGSDNKEARMRQKKAYDFMVSFRETFSRPVRRIRFLGLFDTVNSVPRFENAIMNRRRVPFSAISSAKVIRHAVSIDERRAKFRADLVSHGLEARKEETRRHEILAGGLSHQLDWAHRTKRYKSKPVSKPVPKPPAKTSDTLAPKAAEPRDVVDRGRLGAGRDEEIHTHRYRGHSRTHSRLSHSTAQSTTDPNHRFSLDDKEPQGYGKATGADDSASVAPPIDWDDDASSDGDEDDQDIEELWFPGGHADIGGGWEVKGGETPLSHIPLAWIVREAQRSGLDLDEEKMDALGCLDDSADDMPTIEISTTTGEDKIQGRGDGRPTFNSILIDTACKGKLHDCLRFNEGSPAGTVIRWKIMEYMPFRRLDLTDDGKWKPIRWPLPRGEVRDMPDNVKVHRSAIRRMESNPNYRPGNLIMGGGGRGHIKAPKHKGIGEWIVEGDENDLVGGRVVRVPSTKTEKETEKEKSTSNGENKVVLANGLEPSDLP